MNDPRPTTGQRIGGGQVRDGGRWGRFTLLEILLVLAILSLVLAVVLPRVGRLPKRLAVENALSSVRVAVVEVGMRARASGSPLRLVLDTEGNCFLVETLPAYAVGGQVSPRGASVGTGNADPDARQQGHILATRSKYPIPEGVEWRPDLSGPAELVDEEGRPVFSFYPNGEATGPPTVFTIAGRTFELDVDRLTGRPIIRDMDASI